MNTAVVILNWNGKELLEKFLPSVVKFSREAQIYVADNASTDDSVEFLTAHFQSVKIIRNTQNFGFAKGYNEALKLIDAEIFVLINSDIEVTENWLSPMLETFQCESETAILQPKILDYKKKDAFEYAGAAGGFIDKYGYAFCRGRIFETIENDHGQYDENLKIFWASGACFFIRTSVFKELGGFDESFFAHQEEIDLCWRAFNKNHTAKFISESVVYHVGGATLSASNPKKTYLNFRNSLVMLLKNLPKERLFKVLIFRMILDGLAAFRFLIQFKFSHFLAVFKAHVHFYGKFSTIYKARGSSQSANYSHTYSIVFQYYVKGKKRFSDLF